jgi:hypothetical protein
MNTIDIHLKFPDEATANKLMLENGLLRKFKDQMIQNDGYMIDIIGPIYKATGVILTREEGLEYAEMADIGGWHVNMRGELPETLKPYKITVIGTPYRIWD